jgi:octanoyl-[GcvH]:protein N-octanoyltransferase
MSKPPLRVVRQSLRDRAPFSTAVSRAILVRVASGDLGPTVRLHRPPTSLAFSRQDRASPGYAAAARAARAAGFEPVLRLAGGRAAVFHEGTLACAWAVPDRHPAARTTERFSELATLLAAALRGLGVDARIGEVPGEYCRGAWSINARGRTKLVGIGQRLIAGGAHRGAVIVVAGSGRVRDALMPVYEALDLAWDPGTAGSVEDEVGGLGLEAVESAILSELERSYELRDAELDPATLELASRLEPEHRVDPLDRRMDDNRLAESE